MTYMSTAGFGELNTSLWLIGLPTILLLLLLFHLSPKGWINGCQFNPLTLLGVNNSVDDCRVTSPKLSMVVLTGIWLSRTAIKKLLFPQSTRSTLFSFDGKYRPVPNICHHL